MFGVEEDEDGWVNIGTQDEAVRWSEIRKYAGWAALQHERVYTRLLDIDSGGLYSLSLSGAISYSILLQNQRSWYSGDLYAPQSPTPHYLRLVPGSYEIVVLYAYDVRVSGDPPSGIPQGQWKLEVKKKAEGGCNVVGTIVPDMVNGWLMGTIAGVEIQNLGENTLQIEGVVAELAELRVSFPSTFVAPLQTRLLPLTLSQLSPFSSNITELPFSLATSSSSKSFRFSLSVIQTSKTKPFLSTFLSNTQTPTYALYTPPSSPGSSSCSSHSNAAVLALHGAGVNPSTARDFWTNSIPAREKSWIVWSLGLTEWGYDWHGPSLRDARSSVDHLEQVETLWEEKITKTRRSCEKKRRKVVVMGHSNGGQGAWHYLSHYPDEVLGGVPASGFVKIQDYVPYTSSRGSHYRDPFLTGILTASLTSFDNDLYASDLVGIPILARHGANDDNVPVYHSREMVSAVQFWSKRSNSSSTISYSEVPDRGHWFDEVFDDPVVLDFIDKLLLNEKASTPTEYLEFTLTTANPDETGSKYGFRIMELDTPGRLARLDVKIYSSLEFGTVAEVKSKGIKSISIDSVSLLERLNITLSTLTHQNQTFPFSPPMSTLNHIALQSSLSSMSSSSHPPPRRYGPLLSIFSSNLPLKLIVGTLGSQVKRNHLRSIALKITRDAYVYGKIDCEILDDVEVIDDETVEGNIVLIGGGRDNLLGRVWGVDWKVDVRFLSSDGFSIHGKVFEVPGQGLLYLAPNPTDSKGLTLVLGGIGYEGLESAYKLFPLRTGVPIPDWVVTSPDRTEGGIVAAGFWGADWKYNPETSYL